MGKPLQVAIISTEKIHTVIGGNESFKVIKRITRPRKLRLIVLGSSMKVFVLLLKSG